MAKSFREAFQGVQEELERLMETRYVLLKKLKDRGVITNRHNILVGVIRHVV